MSDGQRLTRRGFLTGAGAVLGAPYVLGLASLKSACGVPANDRINVACIGVRNMGNSHLRSLRGSSQTQVVAICDVDSEILGKRMEETEQHYARRSGKGSFSGVDAHTDYREVMARDDIDAVVIAVPDHNHVPIAAAAVEAGKDVYLEKPMTLTIRGGRILSDLVERHGAVLQVGSQQRSGGGFRRACELVRNGVLGELRTVHVGISTRSGSARGWEPQPVPEELDYGLWLGPAPYNPYHGARCHYQFRFVTDFSGGDVTNWGAHHLDVAQWGIGVSRSGPVAVRGQGQRNPPYSRHDCFYDIRVDYEYGNGVELRLRSGGGGVRFEGPKGSIFVNRRSLTAEPESILKTPVPPGGVKLRRPHGGHMGDFLHCVRTRGTPIAPVEVGHRSATVCHLANIAMTLDRPLRWDPDGERFIGDEEANRMRWRPYREPWYL